MTTIDMNHPAFTRALADLRPALDHLPVDRLEPIRLDLEAALMLALGVAPKARAFREAARTQLGEDIAVHFDQLEPAARACGGAHVDHLIGLHGADVEQLVAALGDKRGILLLEAQSLVQKKHISGSLLAELTGGTGYRALAFDVLQLAAAFRKNWSTIEALTPVTAREIDQAEGMADALVTTLGENGQADSTSSPSAELRRRAYTYFVQTYGEVRRAISYLRWEAGDADEIAPSLSSGRNRRSVDADDVVSPVVAPIGTPVVSPVATPGAPVISPDMPGAPPFVSP